MAEVTIKVPDEQVSFFMDLVKKLGYITESEPPKIEQWQHDVVEERMEKYKKAPYPLKDANDAIDDVINNI